MIISRTPLRVSLLGGGSDLPIFSQKNPGCTVSLAIDQYIYISINKLFNSQEILLKYSQFERVATSADLKHKIARELLTDEGLKGVDISVNSDVPAGTGMGSSSSFTVGLIKAIRERKGSPISKLDLAKKAVEIELHRLHEPIGLQDQYAAAFGGINRFVFGQDGEVTVSPMTFSSEEKTIFEKSLLLVRVGGIRSASQLLSEIQDRDKGESQLKVFSELAQLARNVSKGVLLNPQVLGELIAYSWELKKSTHQDMTNLEVEEKISFGMSAGAFGAKLLGAGSSGFILFVCSPDKMDFLQSKFLPNDVIKPKVDSIGSKIIYSSESGH
jgi:D-glycero-alpha-D-manno-heptose-7-phosphate kinase